MPELTGLQAPAPVLGPRRLPHARTAAGPAAEDLVDGAQLEQGQRVPGDTVALTAWTRQGFQARLGRILLRYKDFARAGAPDPIDWGDKAIARDRLAHGTTDIEIECASLTWSYAPPAAAIREIEASFASVVAARTALEPGEYRAMTDELAAVIVELNQARDGTVLLDPAYLRIVARSA